MLKLKSKPKHDKFSHLNVVNTMPITTVCGGIVVWIAAVTACSPLGSTASVRVTVDYVAIAVRVVTSI